MMSTIIKQDNLSFFRLFSILIFSCLYVSIKTAPIQPTTATSSAAFPYSVVKTDQGEIFDWQNDQIHVRLTGAQTQGLFTLVEDNIKPTFNLPLHLHRQHRETFYILEGDVEFRLNGRTHIAQAGTVVHIPSNTQHAVRTVNGRQAKMIMLYSPAGFENTLRQMKTFTDAQFADEKFMKEFNEKHDNFILE